MGEEVSESSDNRRSVRVTWLGDYRTSIDVRGVHTLSGDEAVEYGGDDTGPMPTELLLASLGSCLCLSITHVARKRRLALTSVEVVARAVKDMKAFRFREIALEVRADLPAAELADLVERSKGYCFVSNTLMEGCTVGIETHSVSDAASGDA